MDNFDDVKVGDWVYVSRFYGVGRDSYYQRTQVKRVTRTQFTCDNDLRYKKNGGAQIGAPRYTYPRAYRNRPVDYDKRLAEYIDYRQITKLQAVKWKNVDRDKRSKILELLELV